MRAAGARKELREGQRVVQTAAKRGIKPVNAPSRRLVFQIAHAGLVAKRGTHLAFAPRGGRLKAEMAISKVRAAHGLRPSATLA